MDYNFDKDLTEVGYYILHDAKTKTYYMRAREASFFVFTSESKFKANMFSENARLVATEIDDFRTLATTLYNDGFNYGYVDGKPITIKPENAIYYDRNSNEIAFAQYVLTSDERYLSIIRKRNLLTLCQIEGDQIKFPMVEVSEGNFAILAYTSAGRIPSKLFEMYKGYHIIYLSYSTPYLVINEQLLVDNKNGNI